MLDGWISNLTRVMDLQKRAREFDKNHTELKRQTRNMAERRTSTHSSHIERPRLHAEEDRRVYPTGLHTALKPLTPARARRSSDGDIQAIPERHRRVEYNRWGPNGNDQNKIINVHPELIKATIKPMGVPLATVQLGG